MSAHPSGASGVAPALAATREAMANRQAELAAAGLAFRAPPPEPTSCCGRGCNGCVWEGFYAAAAWWLTDSERCLADRSRGP